MDRMKRLGYPESATLWAAISMMKTGWLRADPMVLTSRSGCDSLVIDPATWQTKRRGRHQPSWGREWAGKRQ
ncbi:MAG: hypothetical protein IPP45_09855 [Sphingomonadales bacterium]|nr:hypothetical protein [Sphingomonadales bacterium]